MADFYSDGSITLSGKPNALDHGRLTLEFFFNGIFHFGQNIIAFVILSSTSPVTYSIASLFKRVAVICMAIVWFNQTVHMAQALGIVLTFVGLWMYNNAKADVEKGENKMRRVEAAREMILPSNREEHRMMHSNNSSSIRPSIILTTVFIPLIYLAAPSDTPRMTGAFSACVAIRMLSANSRLFTLYCPTA